MKTLLGYIGFAVIYFIIFTLVMFAVAKFTNRDIG